MIFILLTLLTSLTFISTIQAMEPDKLDPDLKQKTNKIAQLLNPNNTELIQAYTNQEQFEAERATTKKDVELVRSSALIEQYAKNKLVINPDNHIHFNQLNTVFTLSFEYVSKEFSESLAIPQHDIKEAIQRMRNQTKANQDPTVSDIYLAMSGYLQWLIKQDSENSDELCAKSRIAMKDALLKSDIEKFKSINIFPTVSADDFAESRTQYLLSASQEK